MEKANQVKKEIEMEEMVPLNHILTVLENRILNGWGPVGLMLENGMYTIFFRKNG